MGDDEQEAPPQSPPQELAYLWGYFLELHAARGSNGFSPTTLTFSEIGRWSALIGIALEAWEVMVIRRLDAEWFKAWNAGRSGRKPNTSVLLCTFPEAVRRRLVICRRWHRTITSTEVDEF